MLVSTENTPIGDVSFLESGITTGQTAVVVSPWSK
jgi:hypothetical protein